MNRKAFNKLAAGLDEVLNITRDDAKPAKLPLGRDALNVLRMVANGQDGQMHMPVVNLLMVLRLIDRRGRITKAGRDALDAVRKSHDSAPAGDVADTNTAHNNQ